MIGEALRDKLLKRDNPNLTFVMVDATEKDLVDVFPKAIRLDPFYPTYEVEGLGDITLASKQTGNKITLIEFEGATIEDELARKDISVNAIAMDMNTGKLVDPFGGYKDIERQLIRHVNQVYNPLILYKVARYSAQLGFGVAPETLSLCSSLTKSQLLEIPIELVREEYDRAMKGLFSDYFFLVLIGAGHLHVHFEECLCEGTPVRFREKSSIS